MSCLRKWHRVLWLTKHCRLYLLSLEGGTSEEALVHARDDAAGNISHRQLNSSPSWAQLWVVSLVVWSTLRGYLVDSWVKMRIICDPETPLGPPWGQTLPGGLLSQHAFLASTHPHWILPPGHASQSIEHRVLTTGPPRKSPYFLYTGYSGSWGHADLCLWILSNSEWLACGHTFPVQTNQFRALIPLPHLLHVSYSLDHYPPAVLNGQTAKDNPCASEPTEIIQTDQS